MSQQQYMTAAGSFMQVPAVHTGLQYQVSGLQPKVHYAMQIDAQQD